jgi:putative heme iron utilization protein
MSDDVSRAVRDLIRGLDRAALACLLPDAEGPRPYASLVLVAFDHDLSPILLLSDLAEHSKAIAADRRVSLLFDATIGLDQPLTGSRVSLIGHAAGSNDERLRRRYLARHPDAAMYAAFTDFRFYRVAVERAHLVGGFGKIRWIDAAELQPRPPPVALIAAEPDIVDHMNKDHAEAVDLYARRLLGRTGDGWRMTGIDAEGIDLRLGGQVARLALADFIADAQDARKVLVSLAARARAA